MGVVMTPMTALLVQLVYDSAVVGQRESRSNRSALRIVVQGSGRGRGRPNATTRAAQRRVLACVEGYLIHVGGTRCQCGTTERNARRPTKSVDQGSIGEIGTGAGLDADVHLVLQVIATRAAGHVSQLH